VLHRKAKGKSEKIFFLEKKGEGKLYCTIKRNFRRKGVRRERERKGRKEGNRSEELGKVRMSSKKEM